MSAPKDKPSARLAWRIDEAAAAVGCGRDKIYSAIKSGDLRARKWGKLTLIRDEDLRAFLEKLPDMSGEEAA